MSFGTVISSTLMALFQMIAAAAAVIDNYSSIERLSDNSSIFSAQLHALYLALDLADTADDDERNFIFYHYGAEIPIEEIRFPMAIPNGHLE